MSTRSGKRIHNSFHENTEVLEPEPVAKSERKTRGKRAKENLEDLSVTLFKNKKRNNYVTYPTDDENVDLAKKDDDTKPSRVLRKNALKEHNIVENNEQEETTSDAKVLIRKSRRWKKAEDAPDDVEESENHENVPTEVPVQPKSKKNKKKKKGTAQLDNASAQEVPAQKASPEKEVPTKKSKKKKKKGKQSSEIIEKVHQNNSQMSVDSFHSAAGSPDGKLLQDPTDQAPNNLNTTFEREKPTKNSKRLSKIDNMPEESSNTASMDVDIPKINGVIEKGSKKRKSIVKDSTFDKSQDLIPAVVLERDVNISKDLKKRSSNLKDATFDKNNTSQSENLNISNMSLRGRRSSIKKSTFDKTSTNMEKESNLNVSKIQRKSITNTTFDKNDISTTDKNIQKVTELDSTSNVSPKQLRKRKSLLANNTFDKTDKAVDTTYEKDTEKDKTFEKDKDKTFDKSNVNEKDTQKMSEDLNMSVNRSSKRRKSNIIDVTFEKDGNTKDKTFDKSNTSITSTNIEKDLQMNSSTASNKQLRSRKSIINSTFEKDKAIDTTYEKDNTFTKDIEPISNEKDTNKLSVNDTYEKTNDTFEKDTSSFDSFKKGAMTRKSSIKDVSFDKNTSIPSLTKEDFEKTENVLSSSGMKRTSNKRQSTVIKNAVPINLDSTFDKTDSETKGKSLRSSKTEEILNTTFDKGTENSKSSLMTSDNSALDKSDVSRISITSDDTTENIVNTTPVLIESSLDESQIKEPVKEALKPETPLKREGTFTKDSPEVKMQSPVTPGRRSSGAMPTAGCTPYHVGKSSQKKRMLNVTRSIEKRASVEAAPRLTRVMFCSPVDNPVVVQEKKKIIKSNLKGSNKSFVFDDSASVSRAGRKRSYTQSDAEDARAKRSRLTEDLQHSVDRLSRPRTTSAAAKFTDTTPKKVTPFKSRADSKPSRTKLPNFAALHQKQFDKMESLDECQERKAKRAKQLLTPTGSTNVVDRISPKNNTEPQKSATKEPKKPKDKTDTPKKQNLPTLESLRPGFTRFGFKLNYDINPFSVPPKDRKPTQKPNGNLQRQGTLPSLTGATSLRREVAKQTVMREKSFGEKRNVNRNENRTIIKGVRTNRRFELQMKLRNID